MKIRLLGAHKIETKNTRCACLLIDDVLAIDAGAITSRLAIEDQQRIKALLITHRHYDHIKDLPMLAMNFFLGEKSLDIYAAQSVIDDVSHYLSDGVLYPDFRTQPPESPAIRFNIVEQGRELSILNYKVLPLEVQHSVPCVGYHITSPSGKKMFYTADTGPGLSEIWRWISPDLLIVEVTATNESHEFALDAGHMTPALLKAEMESFRKIQGYFPRIVTVHADPLHEAKIETELAEVARSLNTEICLGREEMRLEL
jgi:ribonuclease BN (tRNA processing enzyme)